MKHKLLIVGLSLISLWYFHYSQATIIARGNATGIQTFTAKITAKAFDRVNHQLYVGLALPSATGVDFAVSYFDAANGATIPQAVPFNASRQTPFEFTKVAFLTLVTEEGQRGPDIAVVPGTQTTIPDYTGKRVHVITFNGTLLPLMSDLVDASGINVTNGVVALAASNLNIFAAVRPSGGNFGTGNSGIAVVSYINNFSAIVQSGVAQLNNQTAELRIGTTNPTITQNQVALHWNDRLQRLYIGLDLTSGTTMGDGVRAIIAARVVDNVLMFDNIAPDSAFQAGINNIVGGINNGTALRVGIKHIRSMHTSTGPNYLIVNGGVGAPGNTIYALPLVNVNDPNDPAQGTIAAKNTGFNPGTKQFTQPATMNNQMPFIDTMTPANSDFFAVVGRGPLPIESTQAISDIVVAGDTVYVSLNTQNTPQDLDNDTGIWYSQALFDQSGIITDWTPWSKRAFPYNGFPAQSAFDRGRIALFDVDAVNGKLWAINGGDDSADLTRTMLATTSWDFGNDAGTANPTSLVGNLNKVLQDGCFSSLDLDRATPDIGLFGFFGRYALFGGLNKVVFALVSVQKNASQDVITNFSIPSFFQVTQLPENAGCVTSLAYSQQFDDANPENPINYFFAGTQKGLFAFAAPNGEGFPTIALSFLDQPPFSTGIWHKIPNIEGSVVGLKASDDRLNGNLYILTTQATQLGFKSRLYSVPYTTNINTMFTLGNIRLIAESGIEAPNSDLSESTIFLGIENIYTRASRKEQLVLATNAGVFTSHADETGMNLGIINAINQATALWQRENNGGKSLYSGVFGPQYPGKTTTWPITRAHDDCNILNKSIIRQLSGIAIPAVLPSFAFCPLNFTSDHLNKFNSVDTTSYFWSDGARRLFIIKRPHESVKNQLLIFPYNVLEWGIIVPDEFLSANPLFSAPTNANAFVVNDPAFSSITTLYWAQHIGATGILMAGTDRGVLALE